MATPTHGLEYDLFWRIREEAIGGTLQKVDVRQYREENSGRYFYSIDIYFDENTTYHSYLVGHDETDACYEYLDSYNFAGTYITNPHIWCKDGFLYLGNHGPIFEADAEYQLYWSDESRWFGYQKL